MQRQFSVEEMLEITGLAGARERARAIRVVQSVMPRVPQIEQMWLVDICARIASGDDPNSPTPGVSNGAQEEARTSAEGGADATAAVEDDEQEFARVRERVVQSRQRGLGLLRD